MKILLVGEYSRLHNSLKEGLINDDHEVNIAATGDFFKNFPADFKLKRKFDSGIAKKIKVGIYKLSGRDISSINLKKQFFTKREQLKNFDCVQLINENALGLAPREEQQVIDFLYQNNKKLFLLSCGTDYISVKYALEGHFRYSILTPFYKKVASKKSFRPMLRYTKPAFKSLHEFVYKRIRGVIASDLDYHIPLQNHPKYLGLMPNPVNTDRLEAPDNPIEGKLVLFHGINRANYYKKGNNFFTEALTQIEKKYKDSVEVIVTENLPYQEYIKKYNKAHILLDQVYAYDQGYNALEAMAKGKVVFTGAEQEFLEQYGLDEDEVCINALPDVDAIVQKLSELIENPMKIKRIGAKAKDFIKKEHYYESVAKKYVEIWKAH